MNPHLRIIILLLINIACFYFGGFRAGIISLFIVIYRLLSIFGITTTPQIFQNHFKPGICYIKDYKGAYSSHVNEFIYVDKIIKEKNLYDFSIIALYYDNPQTVKEDKLRCSIGLYKINNEGGNGLSPEDERFLINDGFRKHELVDSKSLYICWNYINVFSMMIGIKKCYALLHKKMSNKRFMESFQIKEEQIKVSIEVYDNFFGNKNIHFYVPFENGDKFLIYQKDK